MEDIYFRVRDLNGCVYKGYKGENYVKCLIMKKFIFNDLGVVISFKC